MASLAAECGHVTVPADKSKQKSAAGLPGDVLLSEEKARHCWCFPAPPPDSEGRCDASILLAIMKQQTRLKSQKNGKDNGPLIIGVELAAA